MILAFGKLPQNLPQKITQENSYLQKKKLPQKQKEEKKSTPKVVCCLRQQRTLILASGKLPQTLPQKLPTLKRKEKVTPKKPYPESCLLPSATKAVIGTCSTNLRWPIGHRLSAGLRPAQYRAATYSVIQ